VPETTSAATTSIDTTTTEPVRTWTLLAGGDVLMTRTEPAGIDPFPFLDPPLGSSDFSLVNVEMAISDRGEPHWKEFVFRAPPSAAERIADGGVSVANLANNHANDYGPDALTDTIDLLEEAGVTTVGAGRNADEAYQYRLLSTENGVQVAFVGASMIVPSSFAAGSSTPGIASAHSPARARVLDTVRAAGAEADAVVVAVHWGIERDTCPSNDQRLFARQLLEAGADAVIGHHPHVLQPVELVGAKLVAYSLGNFIWHVRSGILGETGVLQIDFDGDGVVTWAFHPHVLDSNGVPTPADSGERVERIRDIIAGDCAPHDPPPPERTTTTTTTTTTLPPPTGTAGV
jgi:poly-gamma-glutamate synthesis protein (capsule biosynthesis protein)